MKINPIFQELHKKYNPNQQDLLKIQMNKHTTILTDNQFLVIKNMIPEIETEPIETEPDPQRRYDLPLTT